MPELNLSRVFVLTGPGTCSASESIINGLTGIDVEVIQIGSATRGKPFGFIPLIIAGRPGSVFNLEEPNRKALAIIPMALRRLRLRHWMVHNCRAVRFRMTLQRLLVTLQKQGLRRRWFTASMVAVLLLQV
ncbi:MAG: hypothetical protein VB957_10750 [Pseudomonadales bacterium]